MLTRCKEEKSKKKYPAISTGKYTVVAFRDMALFSFMKFPKCMNTMWLLQPGIFLAPGLSLMHVVVIS